MQFTTVQVMLLKYLLITLTGLIIITESAPMLGYIKYNVPQGTLINPDDDVKGSCPLIWMPVQYKYGNIKRLPPEAIRIGNINVNSEQLYYAMYMNSSDEPFIITNNFAPLCSASINASNLMWNRLLILSNPHRCDIGWHDANTDVTSFAVHPIVNDHFIFSHPSDQQFNGHSTCANDYYTRFTSESNLSHSSLTNNKLILYVSDTIDFKATRNWFKLVIQEIRADKMKLITNKQPILLNSTEFIENVSDNDISQLITFTTSHSQRERQSIVNALTATYNIEFTDESRKLFDQLMESIYPIARRVEKSITLKKMMKTRGNLMGDVSNGLVTIWFRMHIVPVKILNSNCANGGWTNKRILATLFRLGSDIEKVTEVDSILVHEDSFTVPVQTISNESIVVETTPLTNNNNVVG